MRIFHVLLIFACTNAFAELDKDQKQALQQTQALLKDSSARQKAIDKDPKAKDIDDKAGALAGSKENKNEMYDLASQLIEKIAAQANGDPEKMQALMLEAQKDPKAFYEKFFDEKQKTRVRDIAEKAQSEKPALNPHK